MTNKRTNGTHTDDLTPERSRCGYCWELATQIAEHHGGTPVEEYRQVHHHAHERQVERCHATACGVRCSRPAGHPDECRFPASGDKLVELGLELITEARRWQIVGIDDLLDQLSIALQAGLDEIEHQRTRATTCDQNLGDLATERDLLAVQLAEVTRDRDRLADAAADLQAELDTEHGMRPRR